MFMINERVVWVANDQSIVVGSVIDIPMIETTRGPERRAVVEWDTAPEWFKGPGPWTTQEIYTSILTVDEYNARMGTDLE